MDNVVTLLKLIAALGVRPIRVPDLPSASVLLPQQKLALIDTAITSGQCEQLLDTVLNVLPDMIDS